MKITARQHIHIRTHNTHKHTFALTVMLFPAVVTACKPNPCKHNGTCSPIGSDYICTCTAAYEGEDCDEGWYCILIMGLMCFHSTL